MVGSCIQEVCFEYVMNRAVRKHMNDQNTEYKAAGGNEFPTTALQALKTQLNVA